MHPRRFIQDLATVMRVAGLLLVPRVVDYAASVSRNDVLPAVVLGLFAGFACRCRS